MDQNEPALLLRLQSALDTHWLFRAVAARIIDVIPNVAFLSVFYDAVTTDGLIAD